MLLNSSCWDPPGRSPGATNFFFAFGDEGCSRLRIAIGHANCGGLRAQNQKHLGRTGSLTAARPASRGAVARNAACPTMFMRVRRLVSSSGSSTLCCTLELTPLLIQVPFTFAVWSIGAAQLFSSRLFLRSSKVLVIFAVLLPPTTPWHSGDETPGDA